jgi:hypothetical protein
MKIKKETAAWLLQNQIGQLQVALERIVELQSDYDYEKGRANEAVVNLIKTQKQVEGLEDTIAKNAYAEVEKMQAENTTLKSQLKELEKANIDAAFKYAEQQKSITKLSAIIDKQNIAVLGEQMPVPEKQYINLQVGDVITADTEFWHAPTEAWLLVKSTVGKQYVKTHVPMRRPA